MHFTYRAKKITGEIYSGSLDAKDRYELFKMVKDMGDEIISYKEREKGGIKNFNITIPFLSKIKTQEKITLARNLGSMVKAGLSASRALSVMARQTKNKELK